jgi:hypothetical protein
MAKPKKKRFISVHVPEELFAKAKRIALAEHRNVSQVVRKLLDEAPEPESQRAAS